MLGLEVGDEGELESSKKLPPKLPTKPPDGIAPAVVLLGGGHRVGVGGSMAVGGVRGVIGLGTSVGLRTARPWRWLPKPRNDLWSLGLASKDAAGVDHEVFMAAEPGEMSLSKSKLHGAMQDPVSKARGAKTMDRWGGVGCRHGGHGGHGIAHELDLEKTHRLFLSVLTCIWPGRELLNMGEAVRIISRDNQLSLLLGWSDEAVLEPWPRLPFVIVATMARLRSEARWMESDGDDRATAAAVVVANLEHRWRWVGVVRSRELRPVSYISEADKPPNENGDI